MCFRFMLHAGIRLGHIFYSSVEWRQAGSRPGQSFLFQWKWYKKDLDTWHLFYERQAHGDKGCKLATFLDVYWYSIATFSCFLVHARSGKWMTSFSKAMHLTQAVFLLLRSRISVKVFFWDNKKLPVNHNELDRDFEYIIKLRIFI